MILPQRPYFPIAPLAAAVAYPAEAGGYDAEKVAELIAAVGLPALADRIDEEAHWNRMLSLGEQQRLGIARALLHAPDYLFLDEATASLDEAAEATLYHLLQQRLPHATIVSIGHRATLAAFHRRRLAIVRDGDHHVLSEAQPDAGGIALVVSPFPPAAVVAKPRRRPSDKRRAAAVAGRRSGEQAWFASLISGCRASGRPTAWR